VYKRARLRYRLLRAGPLVQVRMYHGLDQIRRGFAKNSARFLADDPRRGIVVLASTMLDGVAAPLLLAGLWRRSAPLCGLAIASWVAGAMALLPWLRWFGVTRWYAPLQPVAALTFQLIVLAGIGALRPGGTEWKGRRY
jgi:hypothetical protein